MSEKHTENRKVRNESYIRELNAEQLPNKFNQILIRGWLQTDFKKVSSSHYGATIKIKRLSGAEDCIRLAVPATILEALEKDTIKNQYIKVSGRIHVYGMRSNEIAIIADNVALDKPDEQEKANNVVYLQGKICRKPKIFQKASGTIVTTLPVAVNRDYKITDCIHCVAWGKLAYYIGKNFDIGDTITLQGRLESRTYFLKTDPQNPEYGEYREAYEVAVSHIF